MYAGQFAITSSGNSLEQRFSTNAQQKFFEHAPPTVCQLSSR